MRLNRKNKLLLAGIAIGVYISYSFAFAKTIVYYHKYKEQRNVLSQGIDQPQSYRLLALKEKQLDSLLAGYNKSTGNESFQNQLLRRLTELGKKKQVRITDFAQPHIYEEKNTRKTSYAFTLEGRFGDLLFLVNTMENNPYYGKVINLNIEKKTDYKSNKDYLVAQMVLQKSEHTNHQNTD